MSTSMGDKSNILELIQLGGPSSAEWISVFEQARADLLDPENQKHVQEIRDRHWGENEPVIFKLVDETEVDENHVPITHPFEGPKTEEHGDRKIVGVIVPLKQILAVWYSVKPSKYDEFADCSVEWSRAIIPGYVEVRFQFHGSRQPDLWLVLADCFIDPKDIEQVIPVIHKAVISRRERLQAQFIEEIEGALSTSTMHNLGQGATSHALLGIVAANHEKSVAKKTRENWKKLLELKEDPLNDWEEWSKPLEQLAVEVNHKQADLSVFENLQQFALSRDQAKFSEQKPTTTTTTEQAKFEEQKHAAAPPGEIMRKRKSTKKKKAKQGAADRSLEAKEPVSGHEIRSPSTSMQKELSTSITVDTDQQSEDSYSCFEEQDHQIKLAEEQNPRPNFIDSNIRPRRICRSHSTSSISHNKQLFTAFRRLAGLEIVSDPFIESGHKHLGEEGGGQGHGTSFKSERFEKLEPFPDLEAASFDQGDELSGVLQHCSNMNIRTPSSSSREGSNVPYHCEHKDDDDLSDAEGAPNLDSLNPHLPGDVAGIDLPAYQTWTASRPWIYDDELPPNSSLPKEDITPYLRPRSYVLEPNSRKILPVVVLAARVSGKQPLLMHDGHGSRLVVTPHSEPLADLRQLEYHPDWLPKNKLLEYQAVEMAGHEVWRLDRMKIKCALPSCDKECADIDHTTQLCLGCGPCTVTRYCSKAHQYKHLSEHYSYCGAPEILIPHYVDLDTKPLRYHRRYPTIDDVGELRSFEKHRQRLFAIWYRGQYTLFMPERDPQVVNWPNLIYQDKYGPRLERLLNASFFDQTRDDIVEFLFYMVRMALRKSSKYSKNVAHTLHEQFLLEFDFDTSGARDEDPCECRWLGSGTDERQCNDECRRFHARADLMGHRSGMRQLLEALEADNWVLRIWQRQHPTVVGWRHRLAGDGFPHVQVRDLQKERPRMGRGWMGFGATDTIGGFEPAL